LQESEKQGYRKNIFKGIGCICKQNNVGLRQPNQWMKIRVKQPITKNNKNVYFLVISGITEEYFVVL